MISPPQSSGWNLQPEACYFLTMRFPTLLFFDPPFPQGDEVAVFAYGGSIMTTIFGHGAITFDADLVTHSRNSAETVVSYGSSLGHATGQPHSHVPAGAAQY